MDNRVVDKYLSLIRKGKDKKVAKDDFSLPENFGRTLKHRLAEGAHSLYNDAANRFGNRNILERAMGNARVQAHKLGNNLSDYADDLGKSYNSAKEKLGNFAEQTAENLGNHYNNFVGGLTTPIVESRPGEAALYNPDKMYQLGKEIRSAGINAGNSVKNAWNNLSEGASNAWNEYAPKAQEAMGNAWNRLSESASEASNKLADYAPKAQEAVSNGISNAGNYLKNGMNNLSEGASNAWNNLSESAANAWSGLSPTMQNALKYGGMGLGALGAGYGLYKAFGGGNKPTPPQVAKKPKPVAGARPMNGMRPANGNMGAGGNPKGWITTRTGKRVPVYK